MTIQIILTPDLESMNKDMVYSKFDEVIREYLRKDKWVPRDIYENTKNGKLTDDEFTKLQMLIPEYYLYIDPGKDEEWIHNKTILNLLNRFNVVRVNTGHMKKAAVDTFMENVTKSEMYEKISNVYDYSHVTFARSFEPAQMS